MTEPRELAYKADRSDDARAVDAAGRLLETTRALLVEINPRRAGVTVALDSLLDKDLGLDSLGRIELIARIEQAFDVTLSGKR